MELSSAGCRRRRVVRCRDWASGEMETSVARNPLNVTVVAPGMNPEPRRVMAVPPLPGPVVMSRLARSGRCWEWAGGCLNHNRTLLSHVPPTDPPGGSHGRLSSGLSGDLLESYRHLVLAT